MSNKNADAPTASESSNASPTDRGVVLSASQMMLMFVGCALLGLIGYVVNPAIAFVFVALAAAIVTVGFLGGVANVKNQFGTFGGAAAVFIAVLLILFQFDKPQGSVDLQIADQGASAAGDTKPVEDEAEPGDPMPGGGSSGSVQRRIEAALEIQSELSRISTLVKQHVEGQHVEGLVAPIEGSSTSDIPALTTVFEDLNAKKGLLGQELYDALANKGRTLINLMNAVDSPTVAQQEWKTWKLQSDEVDRLVAKLNR